MSSSSKYCVAKFSYVYRVTIMANVCDDGSTFNPLFVIRVTYTPYRIIDNNNRWDKKNVFVCLPDGPFRAVRDDNASANRQYFSD